MRTGLMRRVVTLQSTTSVSDGMGGATETPLVVAANIPARVEPLQGNELLRAQQTGMIRPHRFTLRYRPGVTGAETILYDGRTFDIKSIADPEEKHRELIIQADEVNA
jgi:SPP1 family predicted phage head-tail adaptor